MESDGALADVLVAVELGAALRLGVVAVPDGNVRQAYCRVQLAQRLFHAFAADVDVLVITPVPLNTGVVVRCRPLAVLKMEDESGMDAKVLAVPVDKLSTLYRNLKSHTELPEIILKQISHFFEHYKDLEPNKWVKIAGWSGVEDARAEIMAGVKNYEQSPDKPRF